MLSPVDVSTDPDATVGVAVSVGVVMIGDGSLSPGSVPEPFVESPSSGSSVSDCVLVVVVDV